MKFLRNLLAAILGSLIAFGILFVIFVFFVSLVGNAEDSITISSNSVLELQIREPVVDYSGIDESDPFGGILDKNQGLDQIIHAIAVAKNDDRIQGISINNNFLLAGLAQTQAIRNELADFKESGKFIYAYGDFFSQRDYYLASVADEVYLNPVGGMDFKGLSTEVLFFKDLQEKTGVKMEVIRHGKYKSAVEPYLANSMSTANRTQLQELIGSIWNTMVTDIGSSREITPENLNRIADTLGGRSPEMANFSGLIDGVVHFDEYENFLKNKLDKDADETIDYVGLEEYIQYANKKKINSGTDKIAVIYAQGEILYGEGNQNIIGQGIVNRALKKARASDAVKAVVLRVDSPGGSALTSDIIWREVMLTKKEKPVVVSMGNVAASGGYYIAVGADKIFAEPTTITGSIGVFGTIPNISELSKDIGINAEQVGTNENSIDYSLFEPMTDTFRSVVREGIESTYKTFLERVSEGRGISIAEADSLAQGRVWSGTDAKEIGLIDALGGLDKAIGEAAKLANLDSYGIRKYPKYKTGFEQVMEELSGASLQSKETLIAKEIGEEAYTILKQVRAAMKQEGIQARMPFVLRIK